MVLILYSINFPELFDNIPKIFRVVERQESGQKLYQYICDQYLPWIQSHVVRGSTFGKEAHNVFQSFK